MAFVIFKLPFSSKITYWKGEINPEANSIKINDKKKFVIGKFNNGSSVYSLEVNEELINENIPYKQLKFSYKNEDAKSLNKQEFCNLLSDAISNINNSELLKKIVLSRTEITRTKINIVNSFKALCTKYPNAFVHLISSEITGTWLGASPEKFIEIKNSKLSTVALAGTLTDGETEWKDKEKKEQKWVEIHIENVMKNLGIEVVKTGPESLEIGDLKHLITKYDAEINTKTNINKIIEELNPTSAVGGIPTNEATAYINQNEQYNREFYSGIIGPYWDKNKIDLFVNLRCLQITNESIIQYAGAGITNESIPEKEWEETKNKMEMTKKHLSFIH